MRPKRNAVSALATVLFAAATAASAQTLETVGTRASGMAGAFVAVASDSSAVWWNPAALPAGPFVDVSIGHGVAVDGGEASRGEARATSFAMTLPLAGLHVTRYSVVGATPARGPAAAARVQVTQAGLTLVQSLAWGVHVGGTLKYLRGGAAVEPRNGPVEGSPARGRRLDLPDSDGQWDADLGLAVVQGRWRVGLLARQLGEPGFPAGGGEIRLDRHVRVGLAFDAAAGDGPPLIVAGDMDLTAVSGPDGARRDLALGVEHWPAPGRLAVRAGVRASTIDEARPVGTAGVSVLVRSGLFLDVSAGSGGSNRSTWNASARVTF